MKFNSRFFSLASVFIAAAISWQVVDVAYAEKEHKDGVKATNQSSINDVVGNWVSEWGPVKFEADKAGVVSGSWEEGKNKIGKISSGKFDASTGSLAYDFCETWTGSKGKATLKLSADHKQLSGTWIRGKGLTSKDKGTWSMHRPNKATETKSK